jgi:hypothetical protein
MRIIILRHYPPNVGPSMVAFADLITHGLRKRGHQVTELTPPTGLEGGYHSDRLGIGLVM